jgi:hypothetical protein
VTFKLVAFSQHARSLLVVFSQQSGCFWLLVIAFDQQSGHFWSLAIAFGQQSGHFQSLAGTVQVTNFG